MGVGGAESMSTSPEVNLWPSAEHALDYLRLIIPSSSVDARALPRLVDVYYVTAVVLLPLLESWAGYGASLRRDAGQPGGYF